MQCPKCKEKIILKLNHRLPLRKNLNQYLRNKYGADDFPFIKIDSVRIERVDGEDILVLK